MKFIINKDILLNQLNILQKGLPQKTPLPITNAIKIDVDNSHITLTASNADLFIQSTVTKDITVIETGHIAVQGRDLISIAHKITSSDVTFYTLKKAESSQLVIEADNYTVKLNLMDVSEYPNEVFSFSENPPYTFDTIKFQDIIKQTTFAAADIDVQRPILTGSHFYNKGKLLYAVSTNGFRLSEKKLLLKEELKDFQVVIPKSSLLELDKILEIVKPDIIDMYMLANIAVFKFANIIFRTRLLDGKYPNTEALIPKERSIEVQFNKQDLIIAIDQVTPLVPKEKERFNIIKLNILPDKTIEISSTTSQKGEAKSIITSCIVNGAPKLEVAFSSKYLLESLRSFISNDIIITFIDTKKPFLITGLKDDNLIQLILPVNLVE